MVLYQGMDLFYIHNDLLIIRQLVNPNQCNKHCLLDNPWLLAQMNPWILPLFRGIEPLKDGFLGVFFGGTMKLWGDQLQYDAKNTYVPLRPSINVYHLFESSCLFSISHFDLPLLLLVFSFDPRHNMSRMGTISTEVKTQQLRSNPRCSIHTSSLQALFLKSKNPGMFSKRSGLKCFELRPYRAISIHVHMCMGEFCHFMIIFLSHEL